MRLGHRRAPLGNSPLRPTWSWDFTRGIAPPGASFTRASTAWCFNAAGTLVSVGNNVPRFDYDPLLGKPWGYLSEMQSTNLTSYSVPDTAHWTTAALTLTVNATTAPDGTAAATTLKEDTSTAAHLVSRSEGSVASGSLYGVSMFVKNVSGARWIQFGLSGGRYLNFQPSTGTLGSSSAGVTQPTAVQLINGWWRVSAVMDPGFTGTADFRVYLCTTSSAGGGPSYTGDGASTVAVWGCQLETAGVGVTSHIPTNGATATRAQDVMTMPLSAVTGWDGTKGGVLAAEYRVATICPTVPGYGQNPVAISDGANNKIELAANYNDGFAHLEATMRAVVYQFAIGVAPTLSGATRIRQVVGWSCSRGVHAYGGVIDGSVGGSFTLPGGMTQIDFGRVGGQSLNGMLESVAYHRNPRSDPFVQGASR